eukprot:CAMPEP_0195651952 /NCGR_PEP_ID=MMETSP0815-20121206/32559_1 /TAXON_ID=97485 /ORGANISM="Prymnesium parvum, Strain Texoma1" /LENGTH=39 /DNA_ID= /DNA_START= /DNA_END= /DNA_ORIENTATION=
MYVELPAIFSRDGRTSLPAIRSRSNTRSAAASSSSELTS